MFGLLELSRQRMHSSFFESNYQVCPHCQGKGMVRTIESGAVYVLRGIEEEGIKNRSSRLNVYVPSETAIYLLNQKRQMLLGLEQKYKMTVIISADDSIKCISDYRIERTKNVKPAEEEKTSRKSNRKPPLKKMPTTTKPGTRKTRKPQAKRITAKAITAAADAETTADAGANRFDRRNNNNGDSGEKNPPHEKQEAVILYNSHEDINSKSEPQNDGGTGEGKNQLGGKTYQRLDTNRHTTWRRLIGSIMLSLAFWRLWLQNRLPHKASV